MIVCRRLFCSSLKFFWNADRDCGGFGHERICVQLTFNCYRRSLHSVAHKRNGPAKCLNTWSGLTQTKEFTHGKGCRQ